MKSKNRLQKRKYWWSKILYIFLMEASLVVDIVLALAGYE